MSWGCLALFFWRSGSKLLRRDCVPDRLLPCQHLRPIKAANMPLAFSHIHSIPVAQTDALSKVCPFTRCKVCCNETVIWVLKRGPRCIKLKKGFLIKEFEKYGVMNCFVGNWKGSWEGEVVFRVLRFLGDANWTGLTPYINTALIHNSSSLGPVHVLMKFPFSSATESNYDERVSNKGPLCVQMIGFISTLWH